jgi:hypothetical protein
LPEGLAWYSAEEVEALPKPVVIHNFWQKKRPSP